jgi:ABC-type Fe3+-citrate transport system substrate-binding protein
MSTNWESDKFWSIYMAVKKEKTTQTAASNVWATMERSLR